MSKSNNMTNNTVITPTTYRILVSTDLGGDPDDIQSLIHLLHYSDILKLEGILSTAGPGSTPRAENIRQWIQRVDLDHLRANGHEALMTEANVLDVVRQGAPLARVPGPGGATDASSLLIERAHADDPLGVGRPLWVLAWGSLTDVAQALHDDPSIAPKICINYIGSSNTTNDPASRDVVFAGLAERCPGLWWIEDGLLPRFSRDTFRGYYTGGDQSGEWGNVTFIEQNIRGRGTTHNGLFDQVLGDAFPVAGWPDGVLKEGDTPTFLYLLSPVVGGVGNVEDPTQASWGGQFQRPFPERFPNYYADLDASAEVCQATISRWRVDYLKDWKRRWGWYDSSGA
jgi:hypothetical protein